MQLLHISKSEWVYLFIHSSSVPYPRNAQNTPWIECQFITGDQKLVHVHTHSHPGQFRLINPPTSMFLKLDNPYGEHEHREKPEPSCLNLLTTQQLNASIKVTSMGP